jgi:hypothetical protein
MKKLLNKKVAMVLTTFVMLTQPVFGQTAFGNFDCGQWIKRTDSAMSKNTTEAWLAGYMSGLNLMYVVYSKRDDVLKRLNSFDQVVLSMDNYCKKNPLSIVSIGAETLFADLATK